MDSNPASAAIPVVVLDDKCSKTPKTHELQVLLQTAANELALINAWRRDLGAIEILIFKVGSGEGVDYESGIWTNIPEDPNAKATDVARRDSSKKIRILVDEAIFESGIAKKMVDKNEAPEDVAFWCLAHEIFHLDEFERMAEVGILMGNRHSSFAGAVRPEFSKPWKTAWQALSSRYPTNEDIPMDLQEAGLIANEASADLTAIHFLKLSGRGWRRFTNSLAAMREEAFQKWAKDQTKFLSRFRPIKAPPYRISEAISSFATNDCEDLPELATIYLLCWKMAFTKALGLLSLDCKLIDTLREVENFPPFDSPAPPAPPNDNGPSSSSCQLI